jgi:hypothetical protein
MNFSKLNALQPAAALPRRLRLAAVPGRVRAGLGAAVAPFALAGHALAQGAGTGTASTAGIGAQVANMAQEGSNMAGNTGSMAMYAAALICLLGGAWALWQSRQPQNRESGRVAMGLTGLVLCGLFAAGGVWINKAANTTSGGNATVTSTAGLVTFGTGAG